jgi:hypothetical protein
MGNSHMNGKDGNIFLNKMTALIMILQFMEKRYAAAAMGIRIVNRGQKSICKKYKEALNAKKACMAQRSNKLSIKNYELYQNYFTSLENDSAYTFGKHNDERVIMTRQFMET